ncbi:hypothetical protein HZH68_007768 [Vespula germanica]|uniref:FMN hydroxy acid dehydrogenase domain-containing protein n=1 Tax=Vespula germanica TaxID=30212 RepID=A0A834K4T7_VESGE|nr:hypothetical protein HZH68_007768 [Vespula germanica]
MASFVCLEDYEKYATNNLPPIVRDYYKSGAGEESSLRWNREAFKRYRIKPRFLRDVSKRDISTTILGEKISMPLGVAPAAMQRMAHPDGECGNAKEHKSLFLYLQTFFQSTKVTIIESQRRMTSWKQQDLPIFTFNQYCSV